MRDQSNDHVVEIKEEEDEVYRELHKRFFHVSFQLVSIVDLRRVVPSDVTRGFVDVP